MKKLIFYLLALALVACGGNTDSKTEKSNESTQASCLAALIPNNQVEKMVSIEEISSIINVHMEDIKLKNNKSSTAQYSTLSFKWEPAEPRKMKIETNAGQGRTIVVETEVSNSISVGNLDLLDKQDDPLAYFNSTYGPKSKAEKEQAKKSIDEAEKTTEVDKQSAKTIKKMVDKQNSNEVDNLGSQAFWKSWSINDVEGVDLTVLHGNVIFKVSTDVSKNKLEDLEMAKKVAQQIIESCK